LLIVWLYSGAKSALGAYDLMVATPMRLVSVLREGALDLSSVEVRGHLSKYHSENGFKQ
jgi:hypothetical protein